MRSVNMESKADKSQCFLMFGLSFNLILTLGSLGFTCYSLHLLYSLVTTVEQNVLLRNPSDQILSRAIVEPTSSETHPCDSRIKKTFCDKRAADKGSRCRKCRSDCPNSSGVSYFCLLVYQISSSQMHKDILRRIWITGTYKAHCCENLSWLKE